MAASTSSETTAGPRPSIRALAPGARAGDYPELEPEVRAGVLAFFNGVGTSFSHTLGLRVVDVRQGYARLELDTRDSLKQPAGVLHGGASFGLADTAVA